MARKDYDKKTVTCYLPSNLEKQVQDYCTEHELTRKAKDEDGNETIEPRWGTGIVKILEDYFNSQVQSTVQDNVQSTVQTQVQNDVQSTVQSTVQDETDETGETKSQKEPTLEERVEKLERELGFLQKDALTRQEFYGWFPQLPQPATQEAEGDAIAQNLENSTNNNEIPTDLSTGGDSEPTKRSSESEEKEASHHDKGNFGQHSTTSTDTAHTEETDHSESLTTVEAEESAIALNTAQLEKKLGIPKTYISKWKKGNDVPKTNESKNWEVYQEWLNWEEFSPDNSKRSMWRRKL